MRSRIPFALALTCTFALVGCPGPSNPEPPDAARPDAGGRDAYVAGDAAGDTGASDAGRDAAGGDDAGDDAQVLVDADLDGGGNDANLPDAFVCTEPTSGCYRCPPSTDPEFLNHCTTPGVTCEPFPVTTARLPLLNADGSLPPLP